MNQSKELHSLIAILLACSFLGCGSESTNRKKNASKDETSKDSAQPAKVVTNSIGMKFKPLNVGMNGVTFTMGSENSNLNPKREVTLTKSFEIGVYEVTQTQYEKVMGNNPSRSKGAQNPVDNVSWEDAVKFCRKLSELPKEKAAGYVYRLPTSAEWEFACRAGTTTKYSFGDDESLLGHYAWHRKNSRVTSHPVGQKKPNDWGLYDMYGNVWEWSQDCYGKITSDPVTDPKGPSTGTIRVFRGGSWDSTFPRSSVALDWGLQDVQRDLGFRVVRSRSTLQ